MIRSKENSGIYTRNLKTSDLAKDQFKEFLPANTLGIYRIKSRSNLQIRTSLLSLGQSKRNETKIFVFCVHRRKKSRKRTKKLSLSKET